MAAAVDDIEAITRQRKAIMKKLEIAWTKLNNHGNVPLDVDDIDWEYNNLNKCETNFRLLMTKAMNLSTTQEAVDIQVAIDVEFDEAHQKIMKRIKQISRTLPKASTSNGGQNSNGNGTAVTADIKLPKMELPTFSGTYTDWTSFHDLFKSIVHGNTKISSAQKLHYLKSSLQGEAAELIKSIEITDANYQRAWDLLIARYDNKRKIITQHIKLLMNQESMTSESASGLRRLLDTTTKHLDALTSLGCNTGYDNILVVMTTERLDRETRKQWQLHSPGSHFPRYADLKTYLSERARALEDACEDASNIKYKDRQPQYPSKNYKPVSRPVKSSSSNQAGNRPTCFLCSEDHGVYHCSKFLNMSQEDRKLCARKHNLCFNCLSSGHGVSQCPSVATCKKCNAKHHTLIHWEKAPDSASNKTTSSSVPKVSSNFGMAARSVLSTALLKVKDASGRLFNCRALLDNGSELSYVTESFVQLLGVKRQKSDLCVTGIWGDISGRSRGLVRLDLKSSASAYELTTDLNILPRLCGYLPQARVNFDRSYLDGIKLADPDFDKPGKIDMLLGADVYFQLLKDKTITYKGRPSIYDTHLGWIVSGSVREARGTRQTTFSHVSVIDIQSQLAKFWELEELQDEPKLTVDEVDCENHFKSTHVRDNTGRFVVSLPFKQDDRTFGDSKEQAIRRLHQVERRLAKNPQHREEYNKFMDEYLEMGHMELIPVQQRIEAPEKCFYLPHHFVLKETSTSTKFRTVFDGSAKSASNVSLNDKLHVGPRLQRDIVDIITRFRLYKYVFTADIAKFFRQVLVKPEDRNFQRILWRKSEREPVEEYCLNTVTYGTASAPYLASRALNELANQYASEFPHASQAILNDFYVDDVMTGEHNKKSVLKIQNELQELLKLGQFPLVKWVSNCPAVLENVPPEHRETQLPLVMESDESVKALGLYWNPASDQFFFKVNLERELKKVTKRTLLSDTAKLYDPLGWLAPVIISAKILFQSLWKCNLGWDQELPADLHDEWTRIRTGLFDLNDIRIDRHVINEKDSKHELHGFCDASNLAYAACVYIRSEDPVGTVKTRLICAKTKVAPVKIVSIPRLELCGAVLLAKLLQRVSKTMNISTSTVHAWTDSTIVLNWLDDHPGRWTTFVANRVSEIQGMWPRDVWNHVRTIDNSADCATKGLTALELLNFDLWWHGPAWLNQARVHWPKPFNEKSSEIPEERKVAAMTVQIQDVDLLKRVSSLPKLKRITAYCFGFINNIRKKSEKCTGPLTPTELEDGLHYWVKLAQSQEFSTELDLLVKQKPASKSLASLNPLLDSKGLLRVGGRLEHSNLSYNQKNPILLPQKHELTRMIIRNEHEKLLHGGGQLMLASLSKNFWIVNGKKMVRSCVRACVKCFRFKADAMTQLMGDLPPQRMESGRPFMRTGMDYAGPFTLKTKKGRGASLYKAYIALFVCFATKAIHIELVTDLTTEAFMMSLKRFIARRGKPLEMNSDNGTNFVGANNELKDLYNLYCSETHNREIADFLAEDGISWKFIPPRAPHCGGLWEAGVKSAKYHMRRVIGDTKMTFEEMQTTLQQIEACLNSRPITPQSTDPNDLLALTPGHFLIGEALTSVPEPDLTHLPQNRLDRYQLVQQQLQNFWKRWHQEYLNTLQQRTKWTDPGSNVDVGDMVLMKEDDLPPLKWIMARVLEKHPGKDNLTRVVTLKTATGQMKRDIRKLCRLPLEDY